MDLTCGHAPNAAAPASFIAAKASGQMDARSIRKKPRRGLHLRSMQRIRLTVPDVGKFQSLETQGRMTVEGKLAQAARHVTEGRLIVARQCALISKQKQGGFDTFDSERLLEQFERSLAIFEDHLQKIMQAAGAAE